MVTDSFVTNCGIYYISPGFFSSGALVKSYLELQHIKRSKSRAAVGEVGLGPGQPGLLSSLALLFSLRNSCGPCPGWGDLKIPHWKSLLRLKPPQPPPLFLAVVLPLLEWGLCAGG